MARIIKKGRCDFFRLEIDEGGLERDSGENEQELGFNELSFFIPQNGQEHSLLTSDEKNRSSVEKEEDVSLSDPIKEAQLEREHIIHEARKEAERLKQEAEEILKRAKKEAEEIESNAYAIGYEQGQKDGLEIGKKQFEIGLQHLKDFLESFKEQTKELSKKYEAQMVQIALAVSKKIIEKEVQEDKALIGKVLRSTLDRTIEGSSLIIHMNPRDQENLDEEFLKGLNSPGGNKIEIRPDDTVQRGGCMVETEFGLVDASIESKWISLLDDLAKELKDRTGLELSDEILVDSAKVSNKE